MINKKHTEISEAVSCKAIEILQIKSRLFFLGPTFIAVNPGGFKVQKRNGNQGPAFKIRLHETGGQKAYANPLTEIREQLGAVVNFKGELIKRRKKLPNKLAYLLKSKITEKVIKPGEFFFINTFLIMIMSM